ncbi:ATP-binding protein [Desulfurivibrio alkaliphilus]|uniref:AAA family ATPase n=1 Tax=Desulfurivibrio alkaliphilus (strain DSM 19089 / UNIQEM U267 / AHT2) TaxID=589865 RepID=D6Z2C7_DESAT|nr:ATP-binding protein [Desulfurivibrio alkaliphilus]ADH85702.1 AAA family ATPase [Desulfurivibrio alkaliphilus AHT 2]
MDEASHWFPRNLAPVIKEALADTPVVCLLGPRQCGKTSLAEKTFPKRAFISLDEPNYYRVARHDPAGFIAGLPEEITIDEVQRAPELLPVIKQAVDRDRRPGRFLLTGSANLLLLPKVSESLAGRLEIVNLQPLTESEKERRPGRFLQTFLSGAIEPEIQAPPKSGATGPALVQRLVAGGYPEPLRRSPGRARQWRRQYLKSIIERDIQDVARVKNAEEVTRLLELLALRSAELLNASNLAKELALHRDTVNHYLTILERLFLLRRLPAWHRNNAKRLIKTPKVHLLDSGLAATLAGLKAEDWLAQRERMGHLLESFVIQQIIAQAAWTDPDLRFWHYRDKDQVEVDMVVTRGAKTWGIEVKAAETLNNKDGQGLAHLAEKCGRNFQAGLLLYNGRDILPLGDKKFLAVPMRKLWEL